MPPPNRWAAWLPGSRGGGGGGCGALRVDSPGSSTSREGPAGACPRGDPANQGDLPRAPGALLPASARPHAGQPPRGARAGRRSPAGPCAGPPAGRGPPWPRPGATTCPFLLACPPRRGLNPYLTPLVLWNFPLREKNSADGFFVRGAREGLGQEGPEGGRRRGGGPGAWGPGSGACGGDTGLYLGTNLNGSMTRTHYLWEETTRCPGTDSSRRQALGLGQHPALEGARVPARSAL